MIAQAKVDMSPPAQSSPVDDEVTQEIQRGSGGLLMEILFPVIALAAIAYAAYELVG